jgi:superfamily I DNA and/or RNA helicase
VEVATVNAFQGREKEVIVCSFVRSNEDGDVGFVSDPRRLVVAVTRARRQLVCVGDSATLAAVPAFASLMDRIAQRGAPAWQSVWEPPWDAVFSA